VPVEKMDCNIHSTLPVNLPSTLCNPVQVVTVSVTHMSNHDVLGVKLLDLPIKTQNYYILNEHTHHTSL
jgi:hypothetical protein